VGWRMYEKVLKGRDAKKRFLISEFEPSFSFVYMHITDMNLSKELENRTET
jgi:hypothetical protein